MIIIFTSKIKAKSNKIDDWLYVMSFQVEEIWISSCVLKVYFGDLLEKRIKVQKRKVDKSKKLGFHLPRFSFFLHQKMWVK